MKKLIKSLADRRASRRYAELVRITRARVQPGDLIRVIRGDGTHPAQVLNVRGYAHGVTEVYVQGADHRFAGWATVDTILPEQAR